MSWGSYLRLGRVSNLPTVWTNVLAGAVLAGRQPGAALLALPLLAISLFYTGGMFLNDAFDRKIDARERPGRPIPSGEISAREVFIVGYGMLTLAMLMLLLHLAWSDADASWWALASGAALAGAIILYNAWHKHNPWSPVIMGLCRALVYVTAGLAVGRTLNLPVALGALVLLAYLIGLTYVAKQETLAHFQNLWPLLFLAAPLVYGFPAVTGSVTGAVIYVAFFAWVGYSVFLLIRRTGADIPRAVVSLIAGISLLDALLIARDGGPATAWVWLASLGFLLTLFLQRYVRGS
ncbi:UbiA family prenyltransferase [soil metagenome]